MTRNIAAKILACFGLIVAGIWSVPANAATAAPDCLTTLLTIQSVADAVQAVQDVSKAHDAKTVVCDALNVQAKNADIFSFDYGVPHSPALMLAGLSSDKITPATSLKAFVVSLPSLVGTDSTATSAALDFAPAWVLANNSDLNPVGYAEADDWTRILYRLRVSAAISKGVDGGTDPTKTKPSRAAFGVNISLLDSSDPIMAKGAKDRGPTHWLSCLSAKVDFIAPYIPPPETNYNLMVDAGSKINRLIQLENAIGPLSSGDQALLVPYTIEAERYLDPGTPWAVPASWSDPATRNKGLQDIFHRLRVKIVAIETGKAWTDAESRAAAAINTCVKESSDLAQKGADLQIGAGVVMQGPGGASNWDDFKDPNGVVWIAGKLPFDINQSGQCEKPADGGQRNEASCWVFGGSGRYSAGEMDATGNAATPLFKANVLEAWVGIERIDSKSKFGAYVGYLDQAAADAAGKPFAKSGTRWLISGAYSLTGWDDSLEGLWLVGSYGAANGSTTTLDDKVALLSLTFAPPIITSTFKDSN